MARAVAGLGRRVRITLSEAHAHGGPAAHADRLALDAMAEVELPALAMTPPEQPPATLAPTEVKP